LLLFISTVAAFAVFRPARLRAVAHPV